ncbi:hypothetical protein GCM10025868_25900 [Angustibacter aerolatus]|uniref:Haloacid dehalogenase-like hydrolase n=1 Tax=Angustibacter aerolatus TaxID=1162965 RepID=A0ABQ6JKM4_9ACTN|nr:hypothetical protein GCM10025868_25900 [Angustibacter aerolatus]
MVDWTHYFRDIHCPAVTAPVRKADALRKRRGVAPEPGPRRLDGDPAGVLAIFDMDGTLLSSNVVENYLWLRMPEPRRARPRARDRQPGRPRAVVRAGRAARPRRVPAPGAPPLRGRRPAPGSTRSSTRSSPRTSSSG